MLRITPIDSESHRVVLRLEGRLSGPWVGELREACEQVLSLGNILVLNLAEVSFLDRAGSELLHSIQARGARLQDCSMFVTEQLRTANPR